MHQLDTDLARRAIVDHTRRQADAAVAAGPDVVVPTAPKWTVTDLVVHVGRTQHWVAEIIERRITDPPQRVASACSDDALDAPVFNPAADGRSGTRFWLSSMLNEAARGTHRHDAGRSAQGAQGRAIASTAAESVGGHKHPEAGAPYGAGPAELS